MHECSFVGKTIKINNGNTLRTTQIHQNLQVECGYLCWWHIKIHVCIKMFFIVTNFIQSLADKKVLFLLLFSLFTDCLMGSVYCWVWMIFDFSKTKNDGEWNTTQSHLFNEHCLHIQILVEWSNFNTHLLCRSSKCMNENSIESDENKTKFEIWTMRWWYSN